MAFLLHQLIETSAQHTPASPALLHKDQTISYAELWSMVDKTAAGLAGLGVQANQRVAVYLSKQIETVACLFAASLADAVFVPVNPVLKSPQVGHILRDCAVSVLITSCTRLHSLLGELADCPTLTHVVVIDPPDRSDRADPPPQLPDGCTLHTYGKLPEAARPVSQRVDADMAAILYTSGSTGLPKGVVLTHANMLAGASSVASYLHNQPDDRLLAVLPFSFDYGLSQLTTAFLVGASVVLMDYLLPREVIRAVASYRVTGLAAVPPLWNQLASLAWPDEARASLRYLTNSGGSMPQATTQQLHAALPDTRIYLMYGLTEAFRSTYLDPAELARRPDSIGKAIPNAQVLVVRPDGSECAVDEPGELVHRGPLVARGYWNDTEKTALRFRPAPGQPAGLPIPELAVWSGDQVRRDAEGFLYFIGRNDEMIKTSGYRVSPSEIEDTLLQLPGVEQAVALAAPHPLLGQGIVLLIEGNCDQAEILRHCQHTLPTYMQPAHLVTGTQLPRNANGKIDRALLARQFLEIFG